MSFFLVVFLAAFSDGIVRAAEHKTNVPAATISWKQPTSATTFTMVLARFGTIPYDRADTFELLKPSGTCGSVKCESGCAALSLSSASNSIPTGTPTIMVLEEGTGSCSRLTRAFNAVKGGASGVLILASQGSSKSLEAAVNPSTDSLTMLDHVTVPVGMLSADEGQTLRTTMASYLDNNKKRSRVVVNFNNLFPEADAARIDIWHDTADDCGVLCDKSKAFLNEVTSYVLKGANSAISFVPHFIFQPCQVPGSDVCAASCIGGEKYCHEKDVYVSPYGKLVAQENVRQACLWQLVSQNNTAISGAATRIFWNYKKSFNTQCTTEKKSFNAACSEEVFDNVGGNASLKKNWADCWAGAMSGTDEIAAAEQEQNARVAAGVPWYEKVIVTINDKHYGGLFDYNHVVRAACVALAAPDSEGICQTEADGHCAPGTEGDLFCRSAANERPNRSLCHEDSTANKGYVCACSPGFGAPSEDGTCVDINECEEFTNLCDTQDATSRNVCRNTQGFYSCKTGVANLCTEEGDWGGCWVDAQRELYSCRDNFANYASAARDGRDLPTVAVCDCSILPGCWESNGEECREKCGGGACDSATNTCRKGGGMGGGAIAGVTLGVAALLAIIAGGAFYLYRRQKQKEVRTAVTDYDTFKDGANGDEATAVAYNIGNAPNGMSAAAEYVNSASEGLHNEIPAS